jgi:NAD(P)-dependent dehydrogenase (short-subunit alcohol dehydrogenase family)
MILVTGGFGMIGAHTAQALLDLGEEVVVTRHHSGEVPSFLADRVSVVQLDVTDRDAFLDLGSRHDMTGIVHLAAPRPSIAPSVDGTSVDDPIEFLRINTAGLYNALEAAREWKVRRFAVASSIGVYIGRPEPRWSEELELPTMAIDNPILAFKKAAEPSPDRPWPAPAYSRSCCGSAPSGVRSAIRRRRSTRSPRSSTPSSGEANRRRCTPTTVGTCATRLMPAERSRYS